MACTRPRLNIARVKHNHSIPTNVFGAVFEVRSGRAYHANKESRTQFDMVDGSKVHNYRLLFDKHANILFDL